MNQAITFSTLIWGLIGLNILVFVHELGHFVFARLVGIRVLTFSLGFGPKLIKKTYKGCEFALSLLPLGGYCRMQGESQVNKDMEIQPGDLYYGAPWRRILAVIGGPLFSVVFAWLAFFGMGFLPQTTINLPTKIVVVESDVLDIPFDPSSTFRTGDTILSINNQKVSSFVQVAEMIMLRPNEALSVEIMRNNEPESLTIHTGLDTDQGIGKLSQTLTSWVDLTITSIAPNSAALKAGLLENDRIESVNGQRVAHLHELRAVMTVLKPNTDAPLLVGITRDNEHIEFTLTLDESGVMGVIFLQSVQTPPLGFNASWVQSFRQIRQTLVSYVKGLRLLFGGEVKIDRAISGPVRTTNFIGESLSSVGSAGWYNAFYILGLLSLILGVTNLLPIPMLDGGLILLFMVEWLNKGRPLATRTLHVYQIIGLAIIGFLMIISLRSDFLFLTDWFSNR